MKGGAIKAAPAALQEQPGSTDTDGVDASGSFPDVEAGPSQLPDTSGDAMLAQQLAAEMQRGSYAQAASSCNLFLSMRQYHETQAACCVA